MRTYSLNGTSNTKTRERCFSSSRETNLDIARFTDENSTITLKIDQSRATMSVRVALLASSKPHAEGTVKELQLSHCPARTLVTLEVLAYRDVLGRAVARVVECTTQSYVPAVLAI